jgi:hypothetical protein
MAFFDKFKNIFSKKKDGETPEMPPAAAETPVTDTAENVVVAESIQEPAQGEVSGNPDAPAVSAEEVRAPEAGNAELPAVEPVEESIFGQRPEFFQTEENHDQVLPLYLSEPSVLDAELASAEQEAQTMPWTMLVVSLVIGLGIGSGVILGWYEMGPGKQKIVKVQVEAEKEIKRLKMDLESEKIAQMNVRTGQKRLFELLNDFHRDWNRIPNKPDYFRPTGGKGVVIYWTDGLVWRQYFIYQAKGNGAMRRLHAVPENKNFVYLKNTPKGMYRFSISALDKEGKETAKSEELILKF